MTNTATTWDAGLPEMAVDGLSPFYDELKGHEVDAARELPGGDRKHARRADKRVMLDARRLQNALEHIGRLPEPGEAFHLVTAKRYSLWHVVKAALHLGAPATIAYLGVATLGFSKDNLDELLQLLDGGQISKVDFLFSVYFKSNERESCERLAHELGSRGHRVVAMLTHAKVLLLELTDGRSYVVESSANLRSCSSIEQIALTNDRNLFNFHQAWLDDVLSTKGDIMRGKMPKPTAAKRLAGTLRKDRMNHDEPQPQAGIPDPPLTLDDRARAQWEYHAPLLAACRVLTLADREALTCFSTAAGRRSQAEEELAKHGPVVKSPSGYPIQNPWLAIANKAMEQMLKWGQELGLSPASRTRVRTAPAADAAKTGRARFFKKAG